METEKNQKAIESMLKNLEGIADSVMSGLKLGAINGTKPYISSYSNTVYVPTESKNVMASIDEDGTMRLTLVATHKDMSLYAQFASEMLGRKAEKLEAESNRLKRQADEIRDNIKNLPTEEDEK